MFEFKSLGSGLRVDLPAGAPHDESISKAKLSHTGPPLRYQDV